jgi:hypothetical protein
VLLEHNDPAVTQATAHALANEGISIAQRAGRLRFSPHLYNYNTPAEIENAMEIVITHTPT